MTKHDIELPPLPDLPAYSAEVFDRDVNVVNKTMVEQLMQDYALAAIKADRQRRGEPVNGFYDPGMSLRDYFAAKTMQAIYARLGGAPSAGSDHDGTLTHVAEGAYQMADAMIAQREK